MMHKSLNPRTLAVSAMMAAIVFGLTQIRLYGTPDGGYGHPGDAGILFSAFAFGPGVGAVVGGLGTALADTIGGYPQWAIFSLLIHGFQGWIVGWLARRWPGMRGLIFSAVVGAVIVVVGYVPAGMILDSPAKAWASIPWNILQVLIGSLVGVPLFIAVRQAYPPITRMGGQQQ